MRRLVRHALIVGIVLLGGDHQFNGGRDAEVVLNQLRAEVIVRQGQLRAHHFNEDMGRQLSVLVPASLRH